MSGQGTLDLLGDAPEPTVMHMLMPNMATACGRCTLWDCRHGCERRVERTNGCSWVMNSRETTCPECLAVDIPAEIAHMQSRQAAVS